MLVPEQLGVRGQLAALVGVHLDPPARKAGGGAALPSPANTGYITPAASSLSPKFCSRPPVVQVNDDPGLDGDAQDVRVPFQVGGDHVGDMTHARRRGRLGDDQQPTVRLTTEMGAPCHRRDTGSRVLLTPYSESPRRCTRCPLRAGRRSCRPGWTAGFTSVPASRTCSVTSGADRRVVARYDGGSEA